MARGLEISILGIATVLQVITVYLCFRLIPLTRWRKAWGLVSLAILLIAVQNILRLVQALRSPDIFSLTILIPYSIEMVLSAALLSGVALIKPLFLVSRRADEIYQLFVQKSVQGLVILQSEKIVFANPAFAYLTGYQVEDLLGMNPKQIIQMFHPMDRENIHRILKANNLDTPSQKREIRILNKRGMTFWLEGYYNRSTFKGHPAIQMTFVNITDRKRIETELNESERRHRIISQLTSDYIYSAMVDTNNQVKNEWVNGAFERITGYTLEEMQAGGKNWEDISHPDDKLKSVEARSYALANQPGVIEYRIISKHGEVIWLRDYFQPIWNDYEKRVSHIIGAVQDITNRKVAEKALRDSEARWRGLAENAPTIIATVDPQRRVTWMNRPISQPLGEVIGKDFHAQLPVNERGKFHRALRSVFATGSSHHLEMEFSTSNGHPSWYEMVVGPIHEEDQVSSAILVLTDITERKKAEEQLKYLSNHDILTGLYNRAFFETEVKRLQYSRLYPVTVVMMDVNDLKITNDVYGHAAGDELLRTMAQVIREGFRSEDLVARIGGDEFAVLLPETTEESAQAIIARLREKIEALNTQSHERRLSLSIGSATGQHDAQLVDVIKIADNLMYEDKARYKAGLAFQPVMSPKTD
jgi:diguanylate cyclase (GGDEF)-like protein/PAS domain S-box-containing protein